MSGGNAGDLRLNNAGVHLVRNWTAAAAELESAERSVNSARCVLSNAENELVKWLVPKSATLGERFCLAVEEAFFEVRVVQSEGREIPSGVRSSALDYKVGWRDGKPPREWSARGIR